jgi:hypothetical protein
MTPPDAHQKITYGLITAIVAGGVGWSALGSHKSADVFSVDQAALMQSLASFPKRPVTIFCVPSAGDFCLEMRTALEADGWASTIETALQANPGLWVLSNDPDAAKVASALQSATGIATDTDKAVGVHMAIVVGTPKKAEK